MVSFFKKAKEVLRTGRVRVEGRIERIRRERKADIVTRKIATQKIRSSRRKFFIKEQLEFEKQRQKEITRRRLEILKRQPIKVGGGFFGKTIQPIGKKITKMKKKDDFDKKDIIRPSMTLDDFAKNPFGGKI